MFKIRFSEFQAYCTNQLNLSPHSIRAYMQDLRSFGKFVESGGIDDAPTSDDLVEYHQHLRETASASAATIRRRFATLRSYFNWLEQHRGGKPSPFVGLRLDLKVPKRLPRPIDRPILETFLQSSRIGVAQGAREGLEQNQSTPDRVTGLVARLLLVTGMRIGEITNLRLSDVSGECSRIRVRGKGNRERTVYVTNDRLLRDFVRYWEGRIVDGRSSSHLFLNSRGERLTEAAFRKRLRTLSKSLLIEPHLTPHRFRHSAATLLIEEGVDIRIVQRLLGHASISTTEIYTKVSDSSLLAAIGRADTLGQIDP